MLVILTLLLRFGPLFSHILGSPASVTKSTLLRICMYT